MLYIVATPIGNLEEITLRALTILKSVDYIACEDTRTSKVLFNHYNINTKLVSYHKFNELKMCPKIIEDLKLGKNIALVSDAGMPQICDPGAVLIGELKKEKLAYTVISGPTALINAFVLSGYDAPFTFAGFIPDDNKKRKVLLTELANYCSTLIFYISPHNIKEQLDLLKEYFGNREICLVREISKKFEEIIYSTLDTNYNGVIKGEFVLLLKGKSQNYNFEISIEEHIKKYIDAGLSKSEAIKKVAIDRNIKKSEIYKHSINL